MSQLQPYKMWPLQCPENQGPLTYTYQMQWYVLMGARNYLFSGYAIVILIKQLNNVYVTSQFLYLHCIVGVTCRTYFMKLIHPCLFFWLCYIMSNFFNKYSNYLKKHCRLFTVYMYNKMNKWMSCIWSTDWYILIGPKPFKLFLLVHEVAQFVVSYLYLLLNILISMRFLIMRCM